MDGPASLPRPARGREHRRDARVTGHDWMTVKKYLAEDAPGSPPLEPPRRGSQPRKIDPLAAVVEAWLRRDVTLKASVIHERLVAEHGFDGHYQRGRCTWRRSGRASRTSLGLVDGPLGGMLSLLEACRAATGGRAELIWSGLIWNRRLFYKQALSRGPSCTFGYHRIRSRLRFFTPLTFRKPTMPDCVAVQRKRLSLIRGSGCSASTRSRCPNLLTNHGSGSIPRRSGGH